MAKTVNTAFSEERTAKILQYLEKNERITVNDVMSLCGVSSSTARIQLNNLSQQGLVVRTHGGALRKEAPAENHFIDEARLMKHQPEKLAVAQAARETIRDGDIIAIGGGTTMIYLARCLFDAKNLIVFTNSIYVAYELLPNRNIELHICGGSIRAVDGTCVGPRAEELFNSIKLSRSFTSVDSVSSTYGLTILNPDERTERSLLLSAKKPCILVDHSKFSRGPFSEKVADLSEIALLVTDRGATAEDLAPIRQAGVEVLLA